MLSVEITRIWMFAINLTHKCSQSFETNYLIKKARYATGRVSGRGILILPRIPRPTLRCSLCHVPIGGEVFFWASIHYLTTLSCSFLNDCLSTFLRQVNVIEVIPRFRELRTRAEGCSMVKKKVRRSPFTEPCVYYVNVLKIKKWNCIKNCGKLITIYHQITTKIRFEVTYIFPTK